MKEKDYCFIVQPKPDHKGSEKPFRDFRWIGPYLVEKVLLKNNYIVRELKTNKTQILHRIHLRNYNPEKLPEDIYKEAQWQIDNNIVVPQDDLYTLAWATKFVGHVFHICIIYTHPNAIDFGESYTRGPDTVIVARSFFHSSCAGQNRETYPTSYPSVVHPSNLKSYGQIQDRETATDLHYNDNFTQASESNTDIETAYKRTQQSPSRQSDKPPKLEINNPTTEIIPQNELSHSRGGKYNLRRNPKPNYSEIIYRY